MAIIATSPTDIFTLGGFNYNWNRVGTFSFTKRTKVKHQESFECNPEREFSFNQSFSVSFGFICFVCLFLFCLCFCFVCLFSFCLSVFILSVFQDCVCLSWFGCFVSVLVLCVSLLLFR